MADDGASRMNASERAAANRAARGIDPRKIVIFVDADKQRIKNECFGAERVAVEVMPSAANLVDAADMYHMWVLPAGFSFDFGLGDEERRQ